MIKWVSYFNLDDSLINQHFFFAFQKFCLLLQRKYLRWNNENSFNSMKKILCILLVVVTLQLQGADYEYPYLILTTSSGTQMALAVDGLEMTFENGQLVAKNANGSSAITLAALAAMQFSQTNDGVTDAVDSTQTVGREGSETLYDLCGRRAYRQGTAVRKGLYVVRKANGETSKILVK